MKGHDHNAILYFSILVLLLLFVAGNLFGIEQFWGFNFLKFLPSYWTFLSLAVTAILMLPIVSKRLLSACDSFSHGLMANKARRIKFGVVCSMLLLPLFLYFSSATTLLGDGTFRTNQILKGQLWLPTEIFDFFAHAVLYKFIFRPTGLNVIQCYHVLSALSGVVFVIGIFRLAYFLNPKQSLVTFLLMLSSGVTVLFFGYVESYSILAALLPYIVLSGLKGIEGRTGRVRFVLWYFVGALVHSVSIVLFSGALVIVLLLRHNEVARREKRVAKYLAALILLLLFAAYVGRATGIGDIGRYLLAPFPQEGYQQGIFTVNHWLNLMNWLYLSALPFLFLVGGAVGREKTLTDQLRRRRLFVVWMIALSLLFMFFFVPRLGGPQDWDSFSLPAFLLIPSALIIYLARRDRSLPYQVIPIIFISASTTAGFVSVNSSVLRSTDRFVEIIEVSKFKNLTKEYASLVSLAEYHPEIKERQLEYALKVWEQPPYTRSDSASALYKIGEIYMERRDSARALSYLKMAVAVDTTDLNSHLHLIRYYDQFGAREDLLAMVDTLERRFSHSALGLMNAGTILQQVGEVERAEWNLERSFYLDSTNFFILFYYGALQLQKENYYRCLELLYRALEINPESFLATYYIASAYASLGEMTRARKYLSKAEKLPEASSYERMVWDLKQKLGARQ